MPEIRLHSLNIYWHSGVILEQYVVRLAVNHILTNFTTVSTTIYPVNCVTCCKILWIITYTESYILISFSARGDFLNDVENYVYTGTF